MATVEQVPCGSRSRGEMSCGMSIRALRGSQSGICPEMEIEFLAEGLPQQPNPTLCRWWRCSPGRAWFRWSVSTSFHVYGSAHAERRLRYPGVTRFFSIARACARKTGIQFLDRLHPNHLAGRSPINGRGKALNRNRSQCCHLGKKMTASVRDGDADRSFD